MKKLSISAVFFLAVAAGVVSCKKAPQVIDLDSGTATTIVEFANTGDNVSGASSKYPRFNTDLGSVGNGKSVKFNVNVSYSGAGVAPEDITVNLAIDADALTLYNTQNASGYVAPPTAIYSFPNTVVIKKGTHQSTIEVVITNNASFDFNKNYALPLKIASASYGVISGNFGKAIYSFSARNAYDGLYTMEATAPMVDVTSTSLTGYYPLTMALITFTGNSVALYDVNGVYSKNYFHPILSGGTSVSAYGTFSPVFYFDQTTGKVTSVGNYYGANAGGNLRSGVIDPTGVNQATFNADGSIKSFQVSYIMTQSITVPNDPRTYFKEKFTFKSAR
ncbi:MAG: DUF1735 domain-containing protein [Chitinophagaceae bacterium]